ncbi:hypothetical protein RFI_03041, partial [Reticulomyxa filosa]
NNNNNDNYHQLTYVDQQKTLFDILKSTKKDSTQINHSDGYQSNLGMFHQWNQPKHLGHSITLYFNEKELLEIFFLLSLQNAFHKLKKGKITESAKDFLF